MLGSSAHDNNSPPAQSTPDVVVASATPWGSGALAVVRLSGDGVRDVLSHVAPLRATTPLRPGQQRRCWFRDDEIFDDGVLVFGRAPKTYTGEDTAELTCHGNPIIVERLIAACISAGARLARPGELTRRAVENGKLDLVRAEAVLQVSEARTKRGLEIGRLAMDGAVSEFLERQRTVLLSATAELEARLDYPGDELAHVTDQGLLADLTQVEREVRTLAGTYQTGRYFVHGARVALVGAVNAGKSSLFNALVGRTRALVHDQPGTTRDVLELPVRLGPLAVTLLDTAGERETADPVEAAGLALAQELVSEADLLLVVVRARPEGLSAVEQAILERTKHQPRVVVYNGVDRPGVAAAPAGAVCTVATRGEGLVALQAAMLEVLVDEEPGEARLMIASQRQRDLLGAVAACIRDGIEALPLAGVAAAADALTEALEEVDALTGADTREEVLDALFARFCIGK